MSSEGGIAVYPKTLARVSLVQAIYAYGMLKKCDYDCSYDDVVRNISMCYDVSDGGDEMRIGTMRMHKKLFSSVLEYFLANHEEIESRLDDIINFTKTSDLLLAILSGGIAELMSPVDTPSSIIISEYTNIAAGFISDDEISCVNATLSVVTKMIEQGKIQGVEEPVLCDQVG